MPMTRRHVLGIAGGGALAAAATTGLSSTAAPGSQAAPGSPGAVPEDLGSPITTVRATASAAGTWTDGRPVLFATGGQSGQPMQFVVIDIADGAVLAEHRIDNSFKCHDVKVHEGSVYLASWEGGHVHRYDIASDSIVDLGQPQDDQTTMTRSEPAGDVVYVGTYPAGKVFAHSLADGGFTDLGAVDAEEQYARSLAWDGTHLYVGTEAHARFYRLDPATGESERLPVPWEEGEEFRIYDMAHRNGLIFAYTSPTLTWYVYDIASGEWIDELVQNTQGGISQVDSQGRVYVCNLAEDRFVAYDTVTREWQPTSWQTTIGSAGLQVVTWPDGTEEVVGLNPRAELTRFNPETEEGSTTTVDFPPIGVTIRALGSDPDGRILIGGSAGATTYGEWLTGTEEFRTFTGGPDYRVDAFALQAGRTYFTQYGSGAVYEYDPAKAYDGPPDNPRLLFSLVDEFEQERIYALTPYGGRQLLAGSTGLRAVADGRLVRWDVDAETMTDLGNPLPGHSVASLTMAPGGGLVIGGTSVQVLGGTSPETEAKLFLADPVTGEVVWSGVPEAGAASISEVTTLPDGQVWGLATTGHVFGFDVDNRSFHDSIQVGPPNGSWGMGTLQPYGDVLYGATGSGRVFAVHRRSRQTRDLGPGEHAVVGADGYLYWAADSALVRLQLPRPGVLPRPRD